MAAVLLRLMEIHSQKSNPRCHTTELQALLLDVSTHVVSEDPEQLLITNRDDIRDAFTVTCRW